MMSNHIAVSTEIKNEVTQLLNILYVVSVIHSYLFLLQALEYLITAHPTCNK